MRSAVDMPNVFGMRKGSELVELIKARKLYRDVMNNFERDMGNGKNTHKRGLLAQERRVEIERLMDELRPEIVGDNYEN